MMITYCTLTQAVNSLRRGKILAYPTEAVWGLGCDPYQHDAFLQLLKLKQRPIEKGVILLAGDISQIEFLLKPLSKQRYQEVIQSWTKTTLEQQATTWLLPTCSRIPSWITGQYTQVAVRVSQHPLCQQLCQDMGSFIVSTSANIAQAPPAMTAEQVYQYFANHVDYIQGELGHSQQPSRIIDAITGQILRK